MLVLNPCALKDILGAGAREEKLEYIKTYSKNYISERVEVMRWKKKEYCLHTKREEKDFWWARAFWHLFTASKAFSKSLDLLLSPNCTRAQNRTIRRKGRSSSQQLLGTNKNYLENGHLSLRPVSRFFYRYWYLKFGGHSPLHKWKKNEKKYK